MKFTIVSQKKFVKISGKRKMKISRLVEFWFEVLHRGYRIVDGRGGYVAHDGSFVREPSYEVTVNAPLRMLPRLKLLARCIARLANQEEVWIEYSKEKTTKIKKTTRLRTTESGFNAASKANFRNVPEVTSKNSKVGTN